MIVYVTGHKRRGRSFRQIAGRTHQRVKTNRQIWTTFLTYIRRTFGTWNPRAFIRAVPTNACKYKCQPHATAGNQRRGWFLYSRRLLETVPLSFRRKSHRYFRRKIIQIRFSHYKTLKTCALDFIKKKFFKSTPSGPSPAVFTVVELTEKDGYIKRFFSMFYFVNFIIWILHLNSIWPKWWNVFFF